MEEDDESSLYQAKETTKERLYRLTRNSLFHTYYMLLSSKFPSTFLYVILLIIEFIHSITLLSFNFNYADMLDNLSANESVKEISYIVKILLKLTVCFLQNTTYHFISVLYISVLFILIHISMFFYYQGHFDSKRTNRYFITDLFIKIIFYLDMFIITFLTVPLYIVYFSFFQCSNDKRNVMIIPDLTCGNIFYYVNYSLSIFTLIFMTVIGLLNCLFLNNNQPNDTFIKLPWSNTFNFVRCFCYCEKILLCAFYVFDFKYKYYIKVFISFALCITQCWFRFYNCFYYNSTVKYVKVTFEFAHLILNAIGMIQLFYNSFIYQASSLLVEVSCSIIFGIFSVMLIDKYNYISIYIKDNTDEGKSLRKIQSLLILALQQQDKDIKQTLFLSFLQKHRLRCENSANELNCICKTYIQYIDGLYSENRNKVMIIKQERTALIDRAIMNIKSNSNLHLLKDNNDNNTEHKHTHIHSESEPNDINSIHSTLIPDEFKRTNKKVFSTQKYTKRNLNKRKTRSTLNDAGTIMQLNVKSSDDIEEDKIKELMDYTAGNLELTSTKVLYGIIRLEIESVLYLYPKNANLRILFAYIMMFFLDNIYKALYELMKIPTQSQNILRQYEIFLCKITLERIMTGYECINNKLTAVQSLQVNNDKTNLSMETILLFNNLTNQILDLINSTSKEVIKFWEEILGFSTNITSTQNINSNSLVYNSNLNTNNNLISSTNNFKSDTFNPRPRKYYHSKNNKVVYKYAVVISKNIDKMNLTFKRLKQNENFFNRVVYKLYAEFLSKVICNEEKSREIVSYFNNKKYFWAEEENNKFNRNNILIFKDGKINMDEIGSCVVCGDLQNLGKILHCNLQFGNIFKYEKTEIRREKINKICPPYFSDIHNDFILNYFETGRSHIIAKTKILLGVRSDGLMIPIILYIKTVPNLENSIRFIGLVKKLPKTHPFWSIPKKIKDYDDDIELDNNFRKDRYISYILTNENGLVLGITKNALRLYGIPLNVLLPNGAARETDVYLGKDNKVVNIKHIIEGLQFDNEKLMESISNDIGIEMKLCTDILKNHYNDFVESLQSGNNVVNSSTHGGGNNYNSNNNNSSNTGLMKVLKNFNEKNAFEKTNIQIKQSVLRFNNNKLKVRLFKIIKLKKEEMKNKTSNALNSNNNSSPSFKSNNYLKSKFYYPIQLQQQSNAFQNISKKRSIRSIKHTHSRHISDNNPLSTENDNLITQNKTANGGYFANKHFVKYFKPPFQIRLFLITFIIVLLLLCGCGLSSYFLTNTNMDDLRDYITMYQLSHKRNLNLILVIQMFRMLSFYDNNIINETSFGKDRNYIINKIHQDMNDLLRLNNQIKSYIDTLDYSLEQLFNNKSIDVLSLSYNFTTAHTQSKLSLLLDQIIAKINYLTLNDTQHNTTLQIDEVTKLFYANEILFAQSANKIVTEMIEEIYFIIENYIWGIRDRIEEANSLMENHLRNEHAFGRNNNILKVINYFPFIVIAISVIVFLYLLHKITEYKIAILKVFYVVNKKYGYEIIKRCFMFLEYTSNFTKYTKYDIDTVMKQLSFKSLPTVNDSKSEGKNVTTQNMYNTNYMQFWEREERERQNDYEEKIIGQKVNEELIASKKALRKKMIIVVIELLILLLIFIAYYAVSISLDFVFNKTITNAINNLSLFTMRGWIFSNFVFFYREMLISQESYKNQFTYYMNASYEIEADILLLTNKYPNIPSKDVFQNVILTERKLNTDEYCSTLKSYSEEYYHLYVNDENCLKYYQVNNGIKDNIKIIYSYIQAQKIEGEITDVNELKRRISNNSTFVNYNQLYIALAFVKEMEEVVNGVIKYIDEYSFGSLIRICVFGCCIICEFVMYIIIWRYLNKIVIKDKAILNIIPNEAISYSQRVKNAISSLNNFK